MSHGNRPRVISAIVALALMLLSPSSALAVISSATTITNASVTQTHTLFYNVGSCFGDTWYSFVNWNVRWTRTNGADRDIDTARYETLLAGIGCDGSSNRGYATGTFHPSFGTKNDITWTLTLNFPARRAGNGDGFQGGSAVRAFISRRNGGPSPWQICTNINIVNGYNGCNYI